MQFRAKIVDAAVSSSAGVQVSAPHGKRGLVAPSSRALSTLSHLHVGVLVSANIGLSLGKILKTIAIFKAWKALCAGTAGYWFVISSAPKPYH